MQLKLCPSSIRSNPFKSPTCNLSNRHNATHVQAPPPGGPARPSDPGAAAGRLPPLNHQLTGQAPLFHAKEAIPTFPSKGAGALNPDRRHKGSIPYVPAVVSGPKGGLQLGM